MNQKPRNRFEPHVPVSRDVCQVYSKGTFMGGDKLSTYDPNYVLALKKNGAHIAISFFDISTNKCFIGQFEDDATYSMLRTVVAQIRPVEIILEKNCVPVEIEKLLKNAPIEPIFKYYKPDQCYSTSRTVTVVDKYLIEHDKTTDSIEILREIKDDPD
jgi:DNA mismatch repair protein MSH6